MKKTYLLSILAFLLLLNGCAWKKEQVLGAIQKCADLATLQVAFNKYIFAEQENKFLMIPIGKSQFVAQWQITLTYGIKLDQLKIEDIKINHNKLKITLPPVEVLYFDDGPVEILPEYTTMRDWIKQIDGFKNQIRGNINNELMS